MCGIAPHHGNYIAGRYERWLDFDNVFPIGNLINWMRGWGGMFVCEIKGSGEYVAISGIKGCGTEQNRACVGIGRGWLVGNK